MMLRSVAHQILLSVISPYSRNVNSDSCFDSATRAEWRKAVALFITVSIVQQN